MIVAVVLLMAVSMAFALKKGASVYFRTFALSIFGLCFFCFWQPLRYAIELSSAEPWLAQASLAGLLIVASVVLLLPPVRRVGLVITAVFTAAFFVSAVCVLAFDFQIKNAIADQLGYFDDDLPWANKNIPTDYKALSHAPSGLSFRFPSNWVEKDMEFSYLIVDGHFKQTNAPVEMQVNCFHGSKEPITQVMSSFSQWGENVEQWCNKNSHFYLCGVFYKDTNNQKYVWRYLAYARDSKQRAELYIRSSDAEPSSVETVLSIFKSIDVAVMESPQEQCVSSMDWF